jgi:excisionase family DNA binding protein
MQILSPEDRAVLWQGVITSDQDARGSMLRVLAKEILDALGGRLDLYSGYDELVLESVELLDASGYIGRDSLRQAFEQVDEAEQGPQELVAELAHQLRESADVERLGVSARIRAIELAARWREQLLIGEADKAELSVADVAARYKVTPQAVYKWIEKGWIEAHQTPGGSWRVPAAQFSHAEPGIDEGASLALQKRLLELHGDRAAPTDEELAEELSRRDDE